MDESKILTTFEKAKSALQPWRDRVRKINSTFLDDREELLTTTAPSLNIFAASVFTLRPIFFQGIPKPKATRYHGDTDPVARVGSILLERLLTKLLDKNQAHHTWQRIITDFLLSGLGIPWLRYASTSREIQLEDETLSILRDESILLERVHPLDFVWDHRASTWQECTFVARRIWMDADSIDERFGPSGWHNAITLSGSSSRLDDRIDGKMGIWEIWHKPSKTVFWLSQNSRSILDRMEDPYDLAGFFPCPMPLLRLGGLDDLIPVPDFVLCQDLYAEIDTYTQRISLLSDALKVVGLYNAECKEDLTRLLQARQNKLVPVDSWAMWVQNGGLRGNVEFFPIVDVATTLQHVIALREGAIAKLYEISGISDLMRGRPDPRQTATGTRMQAVYGNLRTMEGQGAVDRQWVDVFRKMAELALTIFEDRSLVELSGALSLTHEDPALIHAALYLLRHEAARDLAIDIESSATLDLLQGADRMEKMEAVQALGKLVSEVTALIRTDPALRELGIALLQQAATVLPGAKGLEGVLAKALPELAAPRPAP
ncbi:MAG: hypothetical protein HQM02_10735, partial [Magnetococcales bacterium]|nr:hypothetical protein [Magnetococcales bacterium]